MIIIYFKNVLFNELLVSCFKHSIPMLLVVSISTKNVNIIK